MTLDNSLSKVMNRYTYEDIRKSLQRRLDNEFMRREVSGMYDYDATIIKTEAVDGESCTYNITMTVTKHKLQQFRGPTGPTECTI